MSLSESDTGRKLIDPAIHRRGLPETLIRRGTTAWAIELVDGKCQNCTQGRAVLRINEAAQAGETSLTEDGGSWPPRCN